MTLRAENICATVKRDLAELCQSSGTLQALVPPQELGAGRQAELAASVQVLNGSSRGRSYSK